MLLPKSCPVCHETYQAQGKSSEEYLVKPPKDIGDSFWLKKGTFKTIPTSHAICFTCHNTDSGIAPEPKNCEMCHKLVAPQQMKADFDAKLAATMGTASSGAPALTAAELAPVVRQSLAAWAAAGLSPVQLARLAGVQYQIGNLGSGVLGLTALDSQVVRLDASGAGLGWSVNTRSVAAERYDLLTVVLHEQAHVLGVDD